MVHDHDACTHMYMRPMIEKAWAWAHQNKCLRKNEIHGEEEAKLILSEDFDLLDEEGQEISMGGTVEMEVSRLRFWGHISWVLVFYDVILLYRFRGLA